MTDDPSSLSEEGNPEELLAKIPEELLSEIGEFCGEIEVAEWGPADTDAPAAATPDEFDSPDAADYPWRTAPRSPLEPHHALEHDEQVAHRLTEKYSSFADRLILVLNEEQRIIGGNDSAKSFFEELWGNIAPAELINLGVLARSGEFLTFQRIRFREHDDEKVFDVLVLIPAWYAASTEDRQRVESFCRDFASGNHLDVLKQSYDKSSRSIARMIQNIELELAGVAEEYQLLLDSLDYNDKYRVSKTEYSLTVSAEGIIRYLETSLRLRKMERKEHWTSDSTTKTTGIHPPPGLQSPDAPAVVSPEPTESTGQQVVFARRIARPGHIALRSRADVAPHVRPRTRRLGAVLQPGQPTPEAAGADGDQDLVAAFKEQGFHFTAVGPRQEQPGAARTEIITASDIARSGKLPYTDRSLRRIMKALAEAGRINLTRIGNSVATDAKGLAEILKYQAASETKPHPGPKPGLRRSTLLDKTG